MFAEFTATTTETATATETTTRAIKAFLINTRSLARVHLNSNETLIGRDTGLHYDGISRKHCMIRHSSDGFFVADLDSKYGTFLNDERLAPNAWKVLKPGDELRLGGMPFQLQSYEANRAVLEKPKLKAVAEPAKSPKSGSTLPLPAAAISEDTGKTSPPKEVAQEGDQYISLWNRVLAESLTCILGTILATILGAVFQNKSLPVSLLESTIILSVVNFIPMIINGQSLGKRITGIKIIMANGSPITLGTVLFREILMKSGSLVLFIVLLGLIGQMNNIAFLATAVIVPMAFAWKTIRDGTPFWDQICGTRAVDASSVTTTPTD